MENATYFLYKSHRSCQKHSNFGREIFRKPCAIWPIVPPFERFNCFQRIKLLYFINWPIWTRWSKSTNLEAFIHDFIDSIKRLINRMVERIGGQLVDVLEKIGRIFGRVHNHGLQIDIRGVSKLTKFYEPLQKLRVRYLYNRFKPASNSILLIVPRRYFCGGSFVLCLGVKSFCAVGALCMFSYF